MGNGAGAGAGAQCVERGPTALEGYQVLDLAIDGRQQTAGQAAVYCGVIGPACLKISAS